MAIGRSPGTIRRFAPVTRQVRFRDRDQAGQALAGARWQRKRDVMTLGTSLRRETRIYRCPEPACNGGYHLSAKRAWHGNTIPAQADAPIMAGCPRPRTVHVIDLENGVGGGSARQEEIQRYWNVYRLEAVGIAPQDLVFVGVSERAARKFRRSLRDEAIKWRIGDNGPDGADHALLDAVNVQRIARRYDRLVIASRDHIFAPLAREARALGMTVRIVTGEKNVSRELKAAAWAQTTIRSLAPANSRPQAPYRTGIAAPHAA